MGLDGSQNTTTLLSEPISTFLPQICQWTIGHIVKSLFQTTFSQPASLDSPPKGSSPASPCTRVKEKNITCLLITRGWEIFPLFPCRQQYTGQGSLHPGEVILSSISTRWDGFFFNLNKVKEGGRANLNTFISSQYLEWRNALQVRIK